MKKIEKAVCSRWPFLLVLIILGCSSPKKQLYYFDHYNYQTTTRQPDTTTIIVDEVQPPDLYASTRASEPVVINKIVVRKPDRRTQNKILQKADTLPNPPVEKQEHRRRIFAATGFSLSVGGITALILSSLYTVPVLPAITVLLTIAGIIFSIIGVKSKKRSYKILAKIGALFPLAVFVLFLLLEVFVFLFFFLVPVE